MALSEVSLTVNPGITGLVGINGAGKSTLLRIMAGTLKPSSGDALLDGRSLYGSKRRDVLPCVGYMPQFFDAPQKSRVRDVLCYIGWMRGMKANAARAAADTLIETIGLADRANSSIGSLSGGMKRRVALAQSLLADPTLVLLDEPTTGLDPEQRVAVRDIIAAQSQRGSTVISSHLIEDLSALADHLVILEQGSVLFCDDIHRFRLLPGDSDEERFLRLLASERVR